MTSLHRYLLTALLAAALTLTLSSSGIGHAAVSAVQSVFVVNTAKNPVPVTAQGVTAIRGTVAISNTPAVTLSPAGNTVRLDSLSNTVGLDPQHNTVQVGNSPANPLPVIAQDTAPSQPVQVEITDTGAYTVPAGQRLVIEQVSGVAALDAQNIPFISAYGYVQTTVAGATASYTFPLGPAYTCPAAVVNYCYDNWSGAGTEQVHLYADPGTTVTGGVAGAQGVTGTVSISGYLVNVP